MRLKFYLLLGTLTFFSCNLFSGNVETGLARQVALNWYRHYAPKSKQQAVITKSVPYKYKGRECFHIVSFDKGGFVLVSANDAVTPVLGYGFDHPVPDSITNEAVKGWFDNYARQIDTAFVLNIQSDASASKWDEILANKFPNLPGDTVGPLLTTTWDQGCYYNDMCPADPGGSCGHTLVGCVATAMAQILKYWNYPEGGVGFHSYIPKTNIQYGRQSVFFNETDYDWFGMPDNVSAQNLAVATLMNHCGVSANMDFSTSASGASLMYATRGFLSNFDYSDSLTRLYRAYCVDSVWIGSLKHDLMHGRPILLEGSNYNGSQGHAWVCDGYRDQNYFHMNWGWSGSSDGFYYYNSLAPAWFNFNFGQSALLNLFPNYSPLTADFSTLGTENPLKLQFVDDSKGNPDSFHWNFGDSTISLFQNPIHNYADTGIYLVRFIIEKGLEHDTIENWVEVRIKPFLLTSIIMGGNDGPGGAWFDYDNDNDLDAFVSGYPYGTRIYRNDSTSFTYIDPGFPYNNCPTYNDPGDIDNDGDLDLIMTGIVPGYLSESHMFRNDSTVFTAINHPFPKSSAPVSLIDYNNDGKQDVFMMCLADKDTSAGLYKNLGNGLYKKLESMPFSLPHEDGSSSWADIDKDGDTDLAFCRHIESMNSTIVKLFINNGNDSFTEKEGLSFPYPPYTHGLPYRVQWVDFNGDGLLDFSINSALYRNEGNYTFVLVIDSCINNTGGKLMDWGDFDNDGDIDLINGVKLLRNEGNETFSYVSCDIIGAHAVFGDWNKDSKLDILSWGYVSPFVTNLYKNVINSSNTPPSVPSGLIALDSSNTVKLVWNASIDNSTPEPSISYNVRVGKTPYGNEIVSCGSDLESGFRRIVKYGNAGLNDFFLVHDLPNGKYYWSVQAIDNSFSGSTFSVIDSFSIVGNNLPPELNHLKKTAYLNTKLSFTLSEFTGNYSDPENDSLFSVRIDTLPVYGTIVLNGIPLTAGQVIPATEIPDLTYINQTIKEDHFHVNAFDGNSWGTFNAKVDVSLLVFEKMAFADSAGISSFAFGDYDNDGDLDLASSTKIYKNDNGTFQNSGLVLSGTGKVNWGDLDTDGYLDLVIGEKVFKNDGTGQFSLTQTLAPMLSESASALGDIYNRNALDYVNSGENYYTGEFFTGIYLNQGQGNLSDSAYNLPGFRTGDAAWGDYDNDGDQDLAISGISPLNNQRKTIIFRNDDGIFTDISANLPGVNLGTLDWGDFDNDGDLDLLLCGSQGTAYDAITKIFRNDGGIFTDIQAALPGTLRGFAKWIDINADGYLDAIVGGLITLSPYPWFSQERKIKVFMNENGSSFSELLNTGLKDLAFVSFARGDVNNDGFPDFILSGINNANQFVTELYRNCYGIDSSFANSPPSIPENLAVKRISGSTVKLFWEPSSDSTTSQNVLTYNLFIGTSPDSVQICSAMARLSDGKRKIPGPGNMGTNLSWIVHDLTPGTYFWGVQAIDNSFQPSAFSSTQTFTLTDPFVRDTAWYSQNVPVKLDAMVFNSVFDDFDHDTLQMIRIDSLPKHGSLQLNEIPVIPGQEILRSDLGLLFYTPFPDFLGEDSIRWNGYNGQNYADQNARIHWIITSFHEASFVFDSLAFGNAMWGDFNNDGRLDILHAGRNSQMNKTIIWEREPDSYINRLIYASGEGMQYYNSGMWEYPWIKWCDIDGDNDLDFIKGSDIANFYKFENNNFIGSQPPLWSITLGYNFDLIDYDNDNNVDLCSTNLIFHNNSGIYVNSGNLPNIYPASHCPVAVADINNDGMQDISYATYYTPVVVFVGKGDGIFDREITSTPIFDHGSIDWGDFDNDEFRDLLILGKQSNGLPISKIYKNNNGLLTEYPASLEQLSDGTARWGDYNNDGRLDILMCGAKQNGVPATLLYENTVYGFVLQPTNFTGVKNGSAEWGDSDNDGDLDIVIMGVDSLGKNITKIYINAYGQNKFIVNSPPSIPANLHDSVSDKTVFLKWDKSTDNTTPQDGLSYNLYIGTSAGSVDILSPMADLTTGFLRVVKRGNTDLNNHWHIDSLQPGTYYWSVQAIDNSFAGSPFAPVQTFTIAAPVPATTTVANDTVGDGEAPCFNASQSITVAGNGTTFMIQNGGSATMIAGENILYLPGTTVEEGGYIHGYIAPAGPWCPMPAIPSSASTTLKTAEKNDGSFGIETGFMIYPNPTTGAFSIELSTAPDETPVTIQCYDLMGSLIAEKKIISGRKLVMTLAGREPGIYLVRVIQGDKSEIMKIIKQ